MRDDQLKIPELPPHFPIRIDWRYQIRKNTHKLILIHFNIPSIPSKRILEEIETAGRPPDCPLSHHRIGIAMSQFRGQDNPNTILPGEKGGGCPCPPLLR